MIKKKIVIIYLDAPEREVDVTELVMEPPSIQVEIG
tara:strand:- start:292 stop:399 length:108 start_codon:yes stop_codon:yes gene_type:complete